MMLDPGDDRLDSLLIEELLEGMLCSLTLACRNKLCAVVGENLLGDPTRSTSDFR